MKKILAYSFIVIVLVGGFLADFGHVNTTEAQLLRCREGSTLQLRPDAGALPGGSGARYVCISDSTGLEVASLSEAEIIGNQLEEAGNKGKEAVVCSPAFAIFNPVECIVTPLSFTVMNIMALFLWLGGALLNFVITYTIVESAQHLDAISGINIAWSVLRDLANMGFIFLLLYSAIKLIIGLDSEGEVSKTVVGVVVVALILNFSLFFTKIVIDATNIVTLGFYNSVENAQVEEVNTRRASDESGVGDESGTGWKVTGIAGALMRPLGISDVFSEKSFKSFQESSQGDYGIIVISLIGSVLFLITGFILFAASILFISRYIILIMLMILSPIAFVSYAFPNARGTFSRWWSALINQAIFPVVFMMLIWVALTILSTAGFASKAGDDSNWAGLVLSTPGAAPGEGTIAILWNFIIVIGFLVFALVVSKGIAQKSGVIGGKLIDKLQSAPGALGRNTASLVGRSTVGRAGAALDKKFGNTGAGNSRFGRFVRDYTTKGLAESKFGGSKSRLDDIKLDKEISAKQRQIDIKKTYSHNSSELDSLNSLTSLTASQQTRKSQLETDIRKMLAQMNKDDFGAMGVEELKKIAQILTDKQMDQIENNEDISDADKGEIRDARVKPLLDVLDKNSAELEALNAIRTPLTTTQQDKKDRLEKEISDQTKNMTEKTILSLDSSVLANRAFAENAPGTIREAIAKSSLTPAVKQAFKAASEEVFTTGTPDQKQAKLNKMTPDQVARLDKAILVDTDVMEHLSPADLEALHPKVDKATRSSIGRHVRARGNAHAGGAEDYILNGAGKDLWL